ncbi:MAG: hypothetical protein ACK5C8_14350, partial [Roseiflexaceae bacterium]
MPRRFTPWHDAGVETFSYDRHVAPHARPTIIPRRHNNTRQRAWVDTSAAPPCASPSGRHAMTPLRYTTYMSIIFVFVDGIGLRAPSADNP